jgi:XTP/dITP diphosphohydrolase
MLCPYPIGAAATRSIPEADNAKVGEKFPVTPMAIPPAGLASLDPTLTALKALIDVIAQLRHPETGCPWDLEQTQTTLIPYILEEAYETVDAIRQGDQAHIAEELGDLLLQVVLQAQVAQDAGHFDLNHITQTLTEKLVRRHPHVFGDGTGQKVTVTNSSDVNRNWDAIKATEQGLDPATAPKLSAKLQRYARTLPPLTGGLKISQKAAKVGFEWDSIDGVWAKFHEELDEFRHALAHESKAAQQSELGDLLFSIIQLARWSDIDPAAALQGTNERFVQRFMQMERFAERPLTDYSLDELEALWQQAKAKLGQGRGNSPAIPGAE